jgi:hypothetical protein
MSWAPQLFGSAGCEECSAGARLALVAQVKAGLVLALCLM